MYYHLLIRVIMPRFLMPRGGGVKKITPPLIIPSSTKVIESRVGVNTGNTYARVVGGLYRSLLRLGKQFDKYPQSKLLIYRKRALDFKQQKLGQQQTAELHAASIYYSNELLDALFANRNTAKLFHPNCNETISIEKIVRNEFRQAHNTYSVTDRVDAAFAAVRRLSSLWKFFTTNIIEGKSVEVDDSSRDEKREKQLLTFKVGEAENLKPGVILAAHPMVQGPLRRAVVLLLEHGEQGSYGVVLNKPTRHLLETGVLNLPENILSSFGKNSVHCGGFIRRLQVLHNVPDALGTAIPHGGSSVFAGCSIEEAARLVKEDPGLAARFHFFVGCCAWNPNELEGELASGYWLPIQTSVDQVVDIVAMKSCSSPDDTGTDIKRIIAIPPSMDLWALLLGGVSPAFQRCVALPSWTDTSSVPSVTF